MERRVVLIRPVERSAKITEMVADGVPARFRSLPFAWAVAGIGKSTIPNSAR